MSIAPQTDALTASPRSLARNPSFTCYWIAQTSIALGESVTSLTLPILVLTTTGSVAQMGIITAIMGAGRLIANLLAGLYVDRWDRRVLMLLCQSLIVLLYATIPLTWWLSGPQVGLLYAVTGPIAFLGSTQLVLGGTALVQIVTREQIERANSRLQTTLALSVLVGYLIAGVSIGRIGPALTIAVETLTDGCALILLAFVRFRPMAAASARPRTGWGGTFAGFGYIWRDPVQRWVIPMRGFIVGLTAGALDLLIFRLEHELHQSQSSVAYLFALATLGGIAGAVLFPLLRRRLGFGVTFLGSLVVEGLVFTAFGINDGLVIAILLGIGYVWSDTLSLLAAISLRQKRTEEAYLGRVTASYQLIIWVTTPISAALVTGQAQRIGAGETMIGMGGLIMLVALISSLTPARAALR